MVVSVTTTTTAKSTGKSAASAKQKMKSVRRKSLALVNSARNRLSAETASALAARRRGIPNSETDVLIEYIDDHASAPPAPPLPAYHQAARSTEGVELPVASRFTHDHSV